MGNTQQNEISRDRTRRLQSLLTLLLMMTIDDAFHHLELAAKQRPETLAEEFNSCFEPIDCLQQVIETLEEGRGEAFSKGIEFQYRYFHRKAFYNCLNPEIQEKLKSQGIYYDIVKIADSSQDNSVPEKESNASPDGDFM